MSFLNIEIKARCNDSSFVRNYLRENKAQYAGMDEQTDTYFKSLTGRLKLREGNIENNLIYYERPDQPGPKSSVFKLIKVENPADLKEVLIRSLGILVVVSKKREIYYIENVKFHIDHVPGLGDFIEIEAGNMLAEKNSQQLQQQCDHYIKLFSIQPRDLISRSYSDMMLEKN